MRITSKLIAEIAKATKSLTGESPAEKVVVWKDGTVSTIDTGTHARGHQGGWEYPRYVFTQPHTRQEIAQTIERENRQAETK